MIFWYISLLVAYFQRSVWECSDHICSCPCYSSLSNFTLLFEGKKRSMAATALLIFATFSSNVIIAIKCIRTEKRPFGFFMLVLLVIFLWRFYVFFLGPTGSKARPLLYCLWALQPPNLVLILQHTGFEIISEGVNIRILKPF